MMLAARAGYTPVVRTLLAYRGPMISDPTASDSQGATPLLMASASGWRCEWRCEWRVAVSLYMCALLLGAPM